jgi:Tol biopolymer transport system component
VSPPLEPNRQAQQLEWSPDGTRIAYVADQETDNLYELYSSAPDGSDNRKVNGALIPGSQGIRAVLYGWSPDGTRIAYQTDQDVAGVQEVYTSAPDGSDNRKVNPPLPLGGSVSGFSWSPDGTRIAYVANGDDVDLRELYTSAPDGSDNRKVNGVLSQGGFGFVTAFQWSPDGARIAYLADQDTPDVLELYTSRPDGSENHKASGEFQTVGGTVSNYAWSPDGAAIAYHASQDDPDLLELYSSRPDGSENHKVNGPLVPDGDVESFEWSPDSERIAYRAAQSATDVFEIYSSRPDGSQNQKANQTLPESGSTSSFAWSPVAVP